MRCQRVLVREKSGKPLLPVKILAGTFGHNNGPKLACIGLAKPWRGRKDVSKHANFLTAEMCPSHSATLYALATPLRERTKPCNGVQRDSYRRPCQDALPFHPQCDDNKSTRHYSAGFVSARACNCELAAGSVLARLRQPSKDHHQPCLCLQTRGHQATRKSSYQIMPIEHCKHTLQLAKILSIGTWAQTCVLCSLLHHRRVPHAHVHKEARALCTAVYHKESNSTLVWHFLASLSNDGNKAPSKPTKCRIANRRV